MPMLIFYGCCSFLQDILDDQNHLTRAMLDAVQVSFAELSDFKKLMYTSVSVDFNAIWDVRCNA